MTKAFRPQGWSGKFRLREHVGHYHWYERRLCTSHILRVGGQLHYLASHAPDAVGKKWRPAWDKFSKRYNKSL